MLARAFKDVVPRYRTMRGYRVPRKGGWDTHGLPVELEAERELGLSTKREIEAYGVEAFNQKCREVGLSLCQRVGADDRPDRFLDRHG